MIALAMLGLLIGTSGCRNSACAARTGDGICVDNDQAAANAG